LFIPQKEENQTCQSLNFKRKKKKENPVFGKKHLEVECASTRKMFVFRLFLMLAGSKVQGKDGARFTFF